MNRLTLIVVALALALTLARAEAKDAPKRPGGCKNGKTYPVRRWAESAVDSQSNRGPGRDQDPRDLLRAGRSFRLHRQGHQGVGAAAPRACRRLLRRLAHLLAPSTHPHEPGSDGAEYQPLGAHHR